MRYIKIAFGMLKMTIISLFSLGSITFKYPIRFSKNVDVRHRNGGKIKLGKHVSVNSNANLAVTENALLYIGDFTGISANSIIVAREKITIGSNVMIGPNVCIYDHDHNYHGSGIMRDMGYTTSPVVIEDNVWIGAGAIILRGVTIGTGSVIAAGTIVNKNIPANSVVYNKRELMIKERT